MLITHRETHLPVLPHIPHPAVHHHPLGAEVLCPRAHQPAPAGRVHAPGLLDVHDRARPVVVREMAGWPRRVVVVGAHHLYRQRGTHDAGCRCCSGEGRAHAEAVEEAALGVLELHQGVADLLQCEGQFIWYICWINLRGGGSRVVAPPRLWKGVVVGMGELASQEEKGRRRRSKEADAMSIVRKNVKER